MIVCQSLAEAIAVPNVVLVVASNPPVAYQQGDAIPVGATLDPAAVAADATRLSGIDNAINTGTVGTITPETGAQLKQMTWAQYSTWFDANFTTAAQCIALLKVVLLVLVRRVF
jgi:hypothetical protein